MKTPMCIIIKDDYAMVMSNGNRELENRLYITDEEEKDIVAVLLSIKRYNKLKARLSKLKKEVAEKEVFFNKMNEYKELYERELSKNEEYKTKTTNFQNISKKEEKYIVALKAKVAGSINSLNTLYDFIENKQKFIDEIKEIKEKGEELPTVSVSELPKIPDTFFQQTWQ